MERLVVGNGGEILTTMKDGDRITRAASIAAFAELESAPQGETFTKLYHKVIPLLVECNLSAAELMIFMHMAVNLR
jgi:hypothetical protein